MSGRILPAQLATSAKPQQLSNEQLQALVLQLQAQLEAQKAREPSVTCKIGEKGGLCIYGLGRYPITLYLSQWDKFMANLDKVRAFVEENRGRFTVKG